MRKRNSDSLTQLANAAARKAAIKVIERAKQTNTPIIIWEEGGVKAVPAEVMEARLKAPSRKSNKQPRNTRNTRKK
jgi:hypothetical protein